jgi:RND family efflux transporter MFP subunit
VTIASAFAVRRVAVLALPVAVLTGAACGGASGPQDAEVADNAVPVTVAIARIETLRDVLVVPGTVVPSTSADWTIHAPEAGVVAELPKAEGDEVLAGDLLVRFDILTISQTIALKQAAMADAERRLMDARREMDRQQVLFDQGLLARNTYEATRSAVNAAEAQVMQAQADLDVASMLQDAARITARFDGVVAMRWKTEGDFVDGTSNDPVLRVVDPTRTQIAIGLPIEQAGRISAGQAATVEGPFADGPIPATVARVMPGGAGDIGAEVRLNYESQTPLALDTALRVEIVLDQRTDAVVVPAEAILRDGSGVYVFIAGTDLVAHRRDVRVGLTVGGLAQVLQGLDAGDRVVVGSADQVSDGAAILVGR